MYLDKYNLKGKTALVTGGAQSIGFSICHALAEAGAAVIIVDSLETEGEKARANLKKKDYQVEFVLLDVTDSHRVAEVARQYNQGDRQIDILVCNAGIARSDTPAEEVMDEHWLNVIDVNLNGVFWCCRSFGQYMLRRKQGVIINMGSMSRFHSE